MISSSLLALNTTYRVMTLHIFTSSQLQPFKLQTCNYKLTWMTNGHLKFNIVQAPAHLPQAYFSCCLSHQLIVNFIHPVAQAKSLRGSGDSLLSLIPTSSLSAVPVGFIFKLHLEFVHVSPLHYSHLSSSQNHLLPGLLQ